MRPARFSSEVIESGRPKSRKISEAPRNESRRRDVDVEERQTSKEYLPSLKSIWGDNTNKNSRKMSRNNPPLLKHRKAKVVVTENAPVPINRRTRLQSNPGQESKDSTTKKRGLHLFHAKKKEDPVVSRHEIENFVLDEEKNENLPTDFEYDLSLYNSPASKGTRSNSGVIRLSAHPCLSSNLERETLYRIGKVMKREVPEEDQGIWNPPTAPKQTSRRVASRRDIPPVPSVDIEEDLPPPTPPQVSSRRTIPNSSPPTPPMRSMRVKKRAIPPMPLEDAAAPPAPPRPGV